jgi:hypothetical protein
MAGKPESVAMGFNDVPDIRRISTTHRNRAGNFEG